MYNILYLLFIISAVLLSLSIVIHKLYISKQKDIMLASHYVAGMAIFIGLYVLSGIMLAFFVPSIVNKTIILFFAFSPFLIGKFATYKHEKICSLIQVFCVLISVVFIFYRG